MLYDAAETHTNAVYEHLEAFTAHSEFDYQFCDRRLVSSIAEQTISSFDVIAIHYSVRLPFDHLAGGIENALRDFKGLKVLFIQDEYENTYRSWHWIKRLGFGLVFSTVPAPNIMKVYPKQEFPATRFENALTGYVSSYAQRQDIKPPSRRTNLVGYRGRSLPLRYGQLGFDKVDIGRIVRDYCISEGLDHDIAWDEDSRIYGDAWPQFVASSRGMLGSESGSNIFDWDGQLAQEVAAARAKNPRASDQDIYDDLLLPKEQPGLMNQISPRIFEAIALRSVLVLLEGTYSGIVKSGVHYLPVRRDGKNLRDVFGALADGRAMDDMAERTFEDIVASGLYSYRAWMMRVDQAISGCLKEVRHLSHGDVHGIAHAGPLTLAPTRRAPPVPPPTTVRRALAEAANPPEALRNLARVTWLQLPEKIREVLRGPLKRLFDRPN
jgi:hypothetical protein